MYTHRLTRLLISRLVAIVGPKKAMITGGCVTPIPSSTRYTRPISTQTRPLASKPGGAELCAASGHPPGSVDYVIVSVPRQVVPMVLRDYIAKGIGGAMLFTSGDSDTDP